MYSQRHKPLESATEIGAVFRHMELSSNFDLNPEPTEIVSVEAP